MSRIVERMAKAMWANRIKVGITIGGMTLPAWEEENEFLHAEVMEEARAAIQALRDPTEDMIYAGWQDGNNGLGKGEEIKSIWQAMIDEALM